MFLSSSSMPGKLLPEEQWGKREKERRKKDRLHPTPPRRRRREARARKRRNRGRRGVSREGKGRREECRKEHSGSSLLRGRLRPQFEDAERDHHQKAQGFEEEQGVRVVRQLVQLWELSRGGGWRSPARQRLDTPDSIKRKRKRKGQGEQGYEEFLRRGAGREEYVECLQNEAQGFGRKKEYEGPRGSQDEKEDGEKLLPKGGALKEREVEGEEKEKKKEKAFERRVAWVKKKEARESAPHALRRKKVGLDGGMTTIRGRRATRTRGQGDLSGARLKVSEKGEASLPATGCSTFFV